MFKLEYVKYLNEISIICVRRESSASVILKISILVFEVFLEYFKGEKNRNDQYWPNIVKRVSSVASISLTITFNSR